MARFIELRFGQADMGQKLLHGNYGDELFVQREIVPIKAIKDAFIVLPDKRNIQITWETGGRMFTRTEYYKDSIDCIRRWVMIRKALGFTARDITRNPVPLPMDEAEYEKWMVDKVRRDARESKEKEGKHDE